VSGAVGLVASAPAVVEPAGVEVRGQSRQLAVAVDVADEQQVGQGLALGGEPGEASPDRLDALMGRLAVAMETAGQLTLAEARDLLGTSRRYAQALLEHMDSEGLTLRLGEARRQRRRPRGASG
jgi:hypothetical protein